MYNSGPHRSRQAIKLHLYNGHFKGDLSSPSFCHMAVEHIVGPALAGNALSRLKPVLHKTSFQSKDRVVFDKSPFQDPR